MSPTPPAPVTRACRERGQAAVFVLLFIGILLISLNFLYKQGRITDAKTSISLLWLERFRGRW